MFPDKRTLSRTLSLSLNCPISSGDDNIITDEEWVPYSLIHLQRLKGNRTAPLEPARTRIGATAKLLDSVVPSKRLTHVVDVFDN